MIRYFAQFSANGVMHALLIEGPHLVPHQSIAQAANVIVGAELPDKFPTVFKARGSQGRTYDVVVTEKRVLEWLRADQPARWDWQGVRVSPIMLAS